MNKTKNEYQERAERFLLDTGTSMTVERAIPQKSPIWAENGAHGYHYSVTLSNKKHSYTFDFWGSIADKEKELNHDRNSYHKAGRKFYPNAYDILACISVGEFNDFEDFCFSLGYSTDSIKAEKTYKMLIEQQKELKKLFTEAQIEQINDIN